MDFFKKRRKEIKEERENLADEDPESDFPISEKRTKQKKFRS